MPATPATADPQRLRRWALVQQGLHKQHAFGRGKAATLNALTQLGYVQIDTISVVARAHHHVLRSRVANYVPNMLDALVAQREVFEYWFHAAAYLPMADFRFALPRMAEVRAGRLHFVGRRDRKVERAVLARIASEGPLAARDFEGNGARGGWWDWKPAKSALEVLFLQGDLMVVERRGFQKYFDLTERVLPDSVNQSVPSTAEYAQHLLDQSLRNFAIVSVPEASYLRRSADLRKVMQAQIADRVADQTLVPMRWPDGGNLFIAAAALDARLPSLGERAHILSPFDNLLIQRKRTQALFDFDYQIECYVPAKKRVYGYFCLPILYRDQFVGRIDCKAHRKQSMLEIKALHTEETPLARSKAWLPAFAKALKNYLQLNGCGELKLSQTASGGISRALRPLLRDVL